MMPPFAKGLHPTGQTRRAPGKGARERAPTDAGGGCLLQHYTAEAYRTTIPPYRKLARATAFAFPEQKSIQNGEKSSALFAATAKQRAG